MCPMTSGREGLTNRFLDAEANAARAELPNVLDAEFDTAIDAGLSDFSVTHTPKILFV
jgi:hypothetical protein